MNEQHILETISDITEFNEIHEFLQDDDLDKALEQVIKLIAKPDVPTGIAPKLIVQLQALATKFSILATAYATLYKDRAGTPNNMKKNIYYTMADSLTKLADALKYSARGVV